MVELLYIVTVSCAVGSTFSRFRHECHWKAQDRIVNSFWFSSTGFRKHDYTGAEAVDGGDL